MKLVRLESKVSATSGWSRLPWLSTVDAVADGDPASDVAGAEPAEAVDDALGEALGEAEALVTARVTGVTVLQPTASDRTPASTIRLSNQPGSARVRHRDPWLENTSVSPLMSHNDSGVRTKDERMCGLVPNRASQSGGVQQLPSAGPVGSLTVGDVCARRAT
ncbi:MAG: hypothetical protein NVS3B26_14320 [Mycobacteriales bacterium]